MSAERARICSQCPAGSFSNETGLTNCTLCAPGSAQRKFGMTVCDQCEVVRHITQQTVCTPTCLTNEYYRYAFRATISTVWVRSSADPAQTALTLM